MYAGFSLDKETSNISTKKTPNHLDQTGQIKQEVIIFLYYTWLVIPCGNENCGNTIYFRQ